MYRHCLLLLIFILLPLSGFAQQPDPQPRTNFHDEYQRYMEDRSGCWVTPLGDFSEYDTVEAEVTEGVLAYNICRTQVDQVIISAAYTQEHANIILVNSASAQFKQRRTRSFAEEYRLEFGETLSISAGPELLRIDLLGVYEGRKELELEVVRRTSRY